MESYAVILMFDDISESRIRKLIQQTAADTGNSYMTDIGIPPHITIGMFLSDCEGDCLQIIEGNFKLFKTGEVHFSSIGVFNPQVIFLAPGMNEYLFESCKTVNRLLDGITEPGEGGRYKPFRWFPHCTIATKLTEVQLRTAFNTAVNEFKQFNVIANRIAFVKCDPYMELKVWKL